MPSKPKPPPRVWSHFPGAFTWGALFAVASGALSFLGIPDNVRAAYIAGWFSVMALSLYGLFREWWKAYSKLKWASGRVSKVLKALSWLFLLPTTGLAITAVLCYFNGTAVHKTLIKHKPWFVQYGDISDDGKQRLYVQARFDNTADYQVKFQVYGKAIVEPLSLTRAKADKITDKLKDDVITLASGGDASVLSLNPPQEDENSTSVPIPGPVVARAVYDDWRKGRNLVFYDVVVYVKEATSDRFAIHDCQITRAITKQANAGVIPGLGTVWVKYPWSEEIPCDQTH